ncbi:hypothetical protein KBI23_01065 [bacterium]|nr:hypothetical protein [bacterium]MBP9808903.1 hypothetical protein [bacterium]
MQSLVLSVALAASCHSAVGAQSHGAPSTSSTPLAPAAHVSLPDIAALKAKVEAEPSDPKVRYAYAEGLRKHGRGKEASHEYLTVTELEPSFYHAYHQLSLVNHDKHVLDEAISRLNFLKEEKPKDMFLRVALSELYEKKGDNYTAGKTLVELVYANAVPEKYVHKINQRIRFLQAKTKDAQAHDKAYGGDEQMESNPPPLPESSLNRDLSISKVKEPKIMQGFGHATLLP